MFHKYNENLLQRCVEHPIIFLMKWYKPSEKPYLIYEILANKITVVKILPLLQRHKSDRSNL